MKIIKEMEQALPTLHLVLQNPDIENQLRAQGKRIDIGELAKIVEENRSRFITPIWEAK